ncbi:MAG: hypothetical protein BWY99_01661 [Synergistetes bacterium ADurb.BinA166]|nr:MAG: hypothetical protein BWY99_01661 [Synergistetes bacterium ADurb.BinA166]
MAKPEAVEELRDDAEFQKNSDLTCQAHCCITHGCKYGKKDCPVEAGRLVQSYPCPDCEEPFRRPPEDDEIIIPRSELFRTLARLKRASEQVTELQQELTLKEEQLRAHRRVSLNSAQASALSADLAATNEAVHKRYAAANKDRA